MQLDAEEVGGYATQNSLMAEDDDGVLLSLYPVNEGLQSADHVHVGLATGVPEGELALVSLLGYARMLLPDLFVGELLADAGIKLIQNSKGYMLDLVQFQVGSSLYSTFKCARQHDYLLPVL